jgi:hypothetical protein
MIKIQSPIMTVRFSDDVFMCSFPGKRGNRRPRSNRIRTSGGPEDCKPWNVSGGLCELMFCIPLAFKLLKGEAPVLLPPNRKRKVNDGWGMLDAGDFAVHVLSRAARQQYFPEHSRRWQW